MKCLKNWIALFGFFGFCFFIQAEPEVYTLKTLRDVNKTFMQRLNSEPVKYCFANLDDFSRVVQSFSIDLDENTLLGVLDDLPERDRKSAEIFEQTQGAYKYSPYKKVRDRYYQILEQIKFVSLVDTFLKETIELLDSAKEQELFVVLMNYQSVIDSGDLELIKKFVQLHHRFLTFIKDNRIALVGSIEECAQDQYLVVAKYCTPFYTIENGLKLLWDDIDKALNVHIGNKLDKESSEVSAAIKAEMKMNVDSYKKITDFSGISDTDKEILFVLLMSFNTVQACKDQQLLDDYVTLHTLFLTFVKNQYLPKINSWQKYEQDVYLSIVKICARFYEQKKENEAFEFDELHSLWQQLQKDLESRVNFVFDKDDLQILKDTDFAAIKNVQKQEAVVAQIGWLLTGAVLDNEQMTSFILILIKVIQVANAEVRHAQSLRDVHVSVWIGFIDKYAALFPENLQPMSKGFKDAYTEKLQELFKKEQSTSDGEKKPALPKAEVDELKGKTERIAGQYSRWQGSEYTVDGTNINAYIQQQIKKNNFVFVSAIGDGNCFHHAFLTSYILSAKNKGPLVAQQRIEKLITLLQTHFVKEMSPYFQVKIDKLQAELTALANNEDSKAEITRISSEIKRFELEITNLNNVVQEIVNTLSSIIFESDYQKILAKLRTYSFYYYMIMFIRTFTHSQLEWTEFASADTGAAAIYEHMGINTIVYDTELAQKYWHVTYTQAKDDQGNPVMVPAYDADGKLTGEMKPKQIPIKTVRTVLKPSEVWRVCGQGTWSISPENLDQFEAYIVRIPGHFDALVRLPG